MAFNHWRINTHLGVKKMYERKVPEDLLPDHRPELGVLVLVGLVVLVHGVRAVFVVHPAGSQHRVGLGAGDLSKDLKGTERIWVTSCRRLSLFCFFIFTKFWWLGMENVKIGTIPTAFRAFWQLPSRRAFYMRDSNIICLCVCVCVCGWVVNS